MARKTASSDTADTLLRHVNGLVAENKGLLAENARLRRLLGQIGDMSRQAPTSRHSTGTNGESRARTDAERHAPKKRRRITDPQALERRRTALAKARQVMAERRAAKKASG